MSVKRISLAVAAAALGAGLIAAVGTPALAFGDESGNKTKASVVHEPIPENATDELGFAKDGLEFGLLSDVSLKNGKLRVTLVPAEFYLGKASKLLNGGLTPPNDYTLVEDESADPVTYAVDSKASLVAVNQLLGNPDTVERESITAKELVANFDELDDTRVPVWVRHADATEFDGPVTALAEQYVP
jgi:hypothetical protein